MTTLPTPAELRDLSNDELVAAIDYARAKAYSHAGEISGLFIRHLGALLDVQLQRAVAPHLALMTKREDKTMICPKCGVDRLIGSCPRSFSYDCPMVGQP